MRATIRQVAAAAGVSVTTVSRVLNGERYVRPEIQERVKKAVADLSFRPSSAARALAGQRSFQIALIYDNPSPYYVYNIQSGARALCVERNFRVLFQECDIGSPGAVAEIAGLIDETHLDGLILAPPVSDDPAILAELIRRRIPFVRIAPGGDLSISPHVWMDDEGAAAEMTSHLIEQGHRRIGFVIGHPDHVASASRLAGYLRSLGEHGIAEDPALIRQGRFDFSSGYDAGRALLLAEQRPSAIFASNDDMAAGVLAATHELGLSVPADVAIAGFDDSDLALLLWPPLTTIRQPTRALAYEAARMLLDGVEEGGSLLSHELVVRASSAVA